MPKFKLHKSLAYVVTVLLLQIILGFLLYTAFNSPTGNSFTWSSIVNYWLLLLVATAGLVYAQVTERLKSWILPCFITIGYLFFILFLLNTDLFKRIPRIKSTSINYELIPLYFTIPGIFHAMLDLILTYFKPDGKLSSNLKNFFFAISVPIGLYLFTIILIPLIRGAHHISFRFDGFLVQAIICIAIAAFLFFFLRIILGNIIGRNLKGNHTFMVLLFGLLLPILGIILSTEFQLFGDFNFILIYVAVVGNAIGLFLLLEKSTVKKFIGFLLACFGLPYVLYFFIVFLPYIPLSFIALIVLGAGIVMLTPSVLLLIQWNVMSKNIVPILKIYGKEKVVSLGIFCFLILPISFVLFCHNHKVLLKDVIAETEYFDASNHEYQDFDIDKLAYIFHQMEKNRRRLSFNSPEKRLPLLSIYYDWYVFDNLQLSRKKAAEIDRLFLGDKTYTFSGYRPPETLTASVKYTYTTEYDKASDFYKTQIDFAITNLDNVGMREFRSEFSLPKDVFISDYYLDIGEERVHGILAEKSAANWIYEQITSQRRDPGILQYVYGNVLSLKVYPFLKNETRTTGFTLHHRNPVHFTINETPVAIDVTPLSQHVIEIASNAFYIPAKVKLDLPKVSAPIQYYFLVDNTREGEIQRAQFEEDYKNLDAKMKENAQILYVDADVNWGKPTTPKKSGFNLLKAVSQIQYMHQDKKTIPFVVVYAANMNRFYGKYTHWELKHQFPYDNFVEYGAWNQQAVSALEFVAFTRNGKSHYVPNDNLPSLISFDETDEFSMQPTSNSYLNALQLRLFHDVNDLNPKRKRTRWLDGLRQSFSQNILTHSTTYISLENKAQEERLLKRQEEIMSASHSDEAGTEMRQMSEPYFWILLLLFFVYIGRQQFLQHKNSKII
ncbi:MSEP-CTERM sorting domain-containing protein [Kordia jejudonensis]|uniref:MSEP-CTERM sorting domain-containing protein n=1 Tax=Kordia jejudonensis TaxID=1348245 RepID=UPI000629BF18|nr:MSEP-CTERM sorting domain-containing protein [Kordia jejudonensis]